MIAISLTAKQSFGKSSTGPFWRTPPDVAIRCSFQAAPHPCIFSTPTVSRIAWCPLKRARCNWDGVAFVQGNVMKGVDI